VNDDAVRVARMRSQRLDGRAAGVAEAVRSVVGIQAQQPRAGALAIRARTQGLTAADVTRALTDERSIVRTWVMRGTIHFVAADDVGWLHDLLAPLFLPGEHRALDKLGVPEADRPRAVEIIAEALSERGPLTRAELCERLERAGIDTAGQKAAHLPRLAALEGHVCFGPPRDGKDTYVLVEDWIGARGARIGREQALAQIARRYAAGHAPAEADDLAAWSGLRRSDARAGWQGAPAPSAEPPPDPPVVRLLPAFDSYLLGYRSRDLAVPADHEKQVWPGGGIVRPAIVANGLVVGTWSRSGSRVALEPFGREPDGAAAEVADVKRFLA
jgi:hypothetical protein